MKSLCICSQSSYVTNKFDFADFLFKLVDSQNVGKSVISWIQTDNQKHSTH